MQNVLITGATGSIGPQVIQEFYDAGYKVRILVHRKVINTLPSGIEIVYGDITDSATIETALKGIDAVVHMAALLHIMKPSPEFRLLYEKINIGGTQTLVDAACRANVKRFVFFSTIAVYGSQNGSILNEKTIISPDTDYARTKASAEQIVLNAKRPDGQPLGTVLRLAAVYGARIKGNYKRLLLALLRRRFIPIGDGSNRRTLIYDKDVARAAVLAVNQIDASGKIYNVTDGQFHTIREINQSICTAIGRNPPRVFIPVVPVRMVVRIIEAVAHLFKRCPPIESSTIDKFIEDIAVEGQRIQTELGFRPEYTLDAGWQDAVGEMRRQGEL